MAIAESNLFSVPYFFPPNLEKAQFPSTNIFMVGWDGNTIGNDAKTGVTRWYGQAAANTEIVGRIVGNFMRELEKSKPGASTQVTAIHCLGKSAVIKLLPRGLAE